MGIELPLAGEMTVEEETPLTHDVIGAAIEVHREMGPGLLESVYQRCMEEELTRRGISYISQAQLPLIYKGKDLNDHFIIDLYFPNQLVVELKAAEKIHPIHLAQALSYMRLTNTNLGLLINFNVPIVKEGLKRLILSEKHRSKPVPHA